MKGFIIMTWGLGFEFAKFVWLFCNLVYIVAEVGKGSSQLYNSNWWQ